MDALMQMESQGGNCFCFHHRLAFESKYALPNCWMLCFRKKVGHCVLQHVNFDTGDHQNCVPAARLAVAIAWWDISIARPNVFST
jgi:hypothetical protein